MEFEGEEGGEGARNEMEWQQTTAAAAAAAAGTGGQGAEEGGVWWASTATMSGVGGCSGA